MFIQERSKSNFEAEDLTRANLATLSNIVALIDKGKLPPGSDGARG